MMAEKVNADAVRQRIAVLIVEKERLDGERQAYEEQLLKLRTQRSSVAAEVGALQHEVDSADESLRLIQENAANSEAEVIRRTHAAEEASKQAAQELEGKLSVARAKLSQLQGEVDTLRARTADLGAVKAEIAALKTKLAGRKGALALHQELVGAQLRADKSVATLTAARDALEAQRLQVRGEKSELEEERAMLIAQLAGWLDMKSEAEAVAGSMRLDVIRAQADMQSLTARAARTETGRRSWSQE